VESYDARQELIERMCYLFAGYDIPFQEVQAKLTLLLYDFDITPSEKALTVYSESKNTLFMQRFLISKKVEGCTVRTLECYGEYTKRILSMIGKNADEITSNDLMAYFAVRMRDGLSPRSIDNERRVMSSFFSFLQRDGMIHQNPVLQLGRTRIKKTPKKAFTDLEIEKMRAELRTSLEHVIFEMLLSTGCRVTELVNIKITDIRDNAISILGKGEKYRIVYMNAKAVVAYEKYMKERRDTNPYLFPRIATERTPIIQLAKLKNIEKKEWYKFPEYVHQTEHADIGTIRNRVKAIGDRAGVDEVHPHKFRRTCATFALQKGMPLTLVSKMLGHESVATTQIYLDLNDDDLRDAHRKYVQQ